MKNQYPLNSLYLYLTWNCNLKCIHCWVDGGSHNKTGINFPDIKDFISKAIKMGLQHIRFTGGEPAIMWDTIWNVIEFTKDKNISYDIETNLTLFNIEKLKYLQKHKVSLSVSVNGITAEEHDAFSMCTGAFVKTMENLGIMRDLNYEVNEIITCVSKDTIPLLKERIAFFETLGTPRVKINIIQSIGRAEDLSKENKLLTPKEQYDLAQYIEELNKSTNIYIYLDVPQCLQSYETFQEVGFSRCGIYNMLCILPDMKIALCGNGTFEKDLVIDDTCNSVDLEKIWSSNPQLIELRKAAETKLQGVCKNCIHFESCRGCCRIVSYRKTRKWNSPYPLCQELYDEELFPKSRLAIIE